MAGQIRSSNKASNLKPVFVLCRQQFSISGCEKYLGKSSIYIFTQKHVKKEKENKKVPKLTEWRKEPRQIRATLG